MTCRWWILTQREGEIQRTGLGVKSMQETLEHLRKRGDTTAQVCSDLAAGWQAVHLTDPTTIARLTGE